MTHLFIIMACIVSGMGPNNQNADRITASNSSVKCNDCCEITGENGVLKIDVGRRSTLKNSVLKMDDWDKYLVDPKMQLRKQRIG